MNVNGDVDMSIIYPFSSEEGQNMIPGIPVADFQALQQWTNPRDRIDLINSSSHMYFPLAQGATSARLATGGGLPHDAEVHLRTSQDQASYIPDVQFYNQVTNVEDLVHDGSSRGTRVVATVNKARRGGAASNSLDGTKATKPPRGAGRKPQAKSVDSDEEDEDDEDSDEQRKRHRESETRRRGRLRDQFQVLSDLVKCPKKTRAQILVCAVSQLQEFQNKVQELEARLESVGSNQTTSTMRVSSQAAGRRAPQVMAQQHQQQQQQQGFAVAYPHQTPVYPQFPMQQVPMQPQTGMQMQPNAPVMAPMPGSVQDNGQFPQPPASAAYPVMPLHTQPQVDVGGITADSRRGLGRFEGQFQHLATLAELGLDDDVVDAAGAITPSAHGSIVGSLTPGTHPCSTSSDSSGRGPSPQVLSQRAMSAHAMSHPHPYGYSHAHMSVAMDDVYPSSMPVAAIGPPMSRGDGTSQQYTLASLTQPSHSHPHSQTSMYANTPPVKATITSHMPAPMPLSVPGSFGSVAFPSLDDTPTAGPLRTSLTTASSSCSSSSGACSGACFPEQERPLFLNTGADNVETPSSPSNPIVRSVVGALQRQLAPLVAEDSFMRPPCMPVDSAPSDLPPCMRGANHHPLHVKTCMMTGRPATTPALISIHHSLLSNVAVCLISLDGKFLDCNAEFLRNMGGARSDLLSTTIFDKTHPDDVPKLVRMFKLMLEGKVNVWESNRRCIVDNGVVVNHFTLSAVKVAQHPLFFVGFCLPREISRTPADADILEAQLNAFPFSLNEGQLEINKPVPPNPNDFISPYEQDEPPKKCVFYSPPEEKNANELDAMVMPPPSATDILADE